TIKSITASRTVLGMVCLLDFSCLSLSVFCTLFFVLCTLYFVLCSLFFEIDPSYIKVQSSKYKVQNSKFKDPTSKGRIISTATQQPPAHDPKPAFPQYKHASF